ncbi:hypothetical protein V6N13_012372 [Hibiscus sabdariffa]
MIPEGHVGPYCEFHGDDGHNIQDCCEFRVTVQALIDKKEIEFFEEANRKYAEPISEGKTVLQKKMTNLREIGASIGNDEPLRMEEAKPKIVTKKRKMSLDSRKTDRRRYIVSRKKDRCTFFIGRDSRKEGRRRFTALRKKERWIIKNNQRMEEESRFKKGGS